MAFVDRMFVYRPRDSGRSVPLKNDEVGSCCVGVSKMPVPFLGYSFIASFFVMVPFSCHRLDPLCHLRTAAFERLPRVDRKSA